MQKTLVWSLIWEDPASSTRCGTKPVCHNYWACALEPRSHNDWAHAPQILEPEHRRACVLQQEKPPQWDTYLLQLERSSHLLQLGKSPHSTADPAQSKTDKLILKKKERVQGTLQKKKKKGVMGMLLTMMPQPQIKTKTILGKPRQPL